MESRIRKVYYVSFPLSDYQAICNAIRDILGVTGEITSDQVANYIRQIAALGTRTALVDANGIALTTDDENASVLVNEEVFE